MTQIKQRKSRFQFDVGEGQITLFWNASARLTSVEWSPHRIGSALTFRGFLTHAQGVPLSMKLLVDSFYQYFENGKPIRDVPWECLDTAGWSDFQQHVYRATALIPHGETRSYSWVACQFGSWKSQRAVGQALRRNPFLILVPCHRVVSSKGELNGFMGARDPAQPAMLLKKRLLDLENRYQNPVFPFFLAPQSEIYKVIA